MQEAIGLLAGMLLGGLLVWLWARGRGETMTEEELSQRFVVKEAYRALEAQSDVMKADLAEKEQEIRQLSAAHSAKEQIVIHLEDQLFGQKEELDKLHQQMEDRFANLAEKLLEEKSRKFTLQNQDQISGLLQPFREKFKAFEEQLEKRYWEEAKERVSLQKEIQQLRDLNMQLSEDAHSLVNALKGDNKTQGDWGEYRLEVLLQRAGLEKGIHYRTQQSFAREDGRQQRPDFIIQLPDDKHLVIDSKVSLKAYEAYFQAENEATKNKHLQAHTTSLKAHIKDLSAKDYSSIHQINSPDYLLMFVPIEPALTLALQQSPQLFLEALDRNIVLVSQTTLLATMRTVSFIWKQEKQKRNVMEIARQGGLLYDKFCSFSEDLQEIGRRLGQAQRSYDNAVRKLSDSAKFGDTLIGRAERIRELGAKASKELPKEWLDTEGE